MCYDCVNDCQWEQRPDVDVSNYRSTSPRVQTRSYTV